MFSPSFDVTIQRFTDDACDSTNVKCLDATHITSSLFANLNQD
jgi:hypothetical protein